MQEAIERLKAVQARAEKSAAGLGYYEASMLLGKAYAGWPQHSGEALDVYGALTEKVPDDFRCAGAVILGLTAHVSTPSQSSQELRQICCFGAQTFCQAVPHCCEYLWALAY